MIDMVIDFHAHILVREIFERSYPYSIVSGFGQRQVKAHNAVLFEEMMSPNKLLEDMDRCGIDISVISSATVMQPTSWADADTECALTRKLNDANAEWAAFSPRHIMGSFTLPLQDTDLALMEMRRSVEQLHLKVANVPSEVRGVYLGDHRFRPFWQAAQDLDVVIFMHPEVNNDPWFQKFGLWNSLGQMIEECKFMASIIYEGILEDYPWLKIVVAHGGGYFPHNIGRLDRNMTNIPHSGKNISRNPSEYLRNVYFDTCLYDPKILLALIRIVGADRLVLGSDYPVGEDNPVEFITSCQELKSIDQKLILGETAASLLGLADRIPAIT
jgi:aminocarboxymuconate-semialdehyde decarboxylase